MKLLGTQPNTVSMSRGKGRFHSIPRAWPFIGNFDKNMPHITKMGEFMLYITKTKTKTSKVSYSSKLII